MKTRQNILLSKLQDRLDKTHLVWVASRAADGRPLSAIAKHLSVACLVGTLAEARGKAGFVLEDVFSERLDYDRFDWDKLSADEAKAILNVILARLKHTETIVVPFSASQLLTNIGVAIPWIRIASPPARIAQAFDHKPWVETQLQRLGVPTVPWYYSVPGRRPVQHQQYETWISRPAVGTGGLGMQEHATFREARFAVECNSSAEIGSIAPFLSDVLSFNVAACVFPSGTVTFHPTSMQLIGESSCTNRPFGYCGNDFETAKSALNIRDVQAIERIVLTTGKWLKSFGFVGAFGLDFLRSKRGLMVSEVNARFQASALLASIIMRNAGLPDIYSDHLAANLGIAPIKPRATMRDILGEQHQLSQIFCYHTNREVPTAVTPGSDRPRLPKYELDSIIRHRRVQYHALLFRMVVSGPVLDPVGKLTKAMQDEVWVVRRAKSRGLMPN